MWGWLMCNTWKNTKQNGAAQCKRKCSGKSSDFSNSWPTEVEFGDFGAPSFTWAMCLCRHSTIYVGIQDHKRPGDISLCCFWGISWQALPCVNTQIGDLVSHARHAMLQTDPLCGPSLSCQGSPTICLCPHFYSQHVSTLTWGDHGQ